MAIKCIFKTVLILFLGLQNASCKSPGIDVLPNQNACLDRINSFIDTHAGVDAKRKLDVSTARCDGEDLNFVLLGNPQPIQHDYCSAVDVAYAADSQSIYTQKLFWIDRATECMGFKRDVQFFDMSADEAATTLTMLLECRSSPKCVERIPSKYRDYTSNKPISVVSKAKGGELQVQFQVDAYRILEISFSPAGDLISSEMSIQ